MTIQAVAASRLAQLVYPGECKAHSEPLPSVEPCDSVGALSWLVHIIDACLSFSLIGFPSTRDSSSELVR